jgi:AcrR family transcriptional regulator
MRLRDVAGRAGIDHSTLHHHFTTKEKLVEALVAEVAGRFRPTMPAAGAPAVLAQLEKLLGGTSSTARR